jgi:lipopolysaccharide O-acetyltransferase
MEERGALMFKNTASFLEENGAYIFFPMLAGRPLSFVRNKMLARKLGARNLRIGPGSRLRGLSNMKIGENFSGGEGLWIEAVTQYNNERYHPLLVIGNHVTISHWSHIACANLVTVGDQVLIGSNVVIADHNHGVVGPNGTSPIIPPVKRPLERDQPVHIKSKVLVCNGAVVCPGVTMGEGSIAASNALVTSDVPAFTFVTGVPAKPTFRYDLSKESWVEL